MSVPIDCNWPLLPYYGTRGATYFQQIDPVRLGDGPNLALVVRAVFGLHSQAGHRRGKWVGTQHTPHYTPSVPYYINRAVLCCMGCGGAALEEAAKS